jgi:hypothetical protein
MSIDITRKYTTRNGREVRIYATDGVGYYPIHGAVKDGDLWHSHVWTKDGARTGGQAVDEWDLIPVKTWRAWKRHEMPVIFMVKRIDENMNGISCIVTRDGSDAEALFKGWKHVHEDGTETPCGVEE